MIEKIQEDSTYEVIGNKVLILASDFDFIIDRINIEFKLLLNVAIILISLTSFH